MKRIGYLAAAVAAVILLSPGGEGDIGDLIPVELLYVYEEDRIWVETDTGQWGSGENLEAALEDLRAASPGEIFLETADYLVVTEDTVSLLPQLSRVLRPATCVCLGKGLDREAAVYLRAHEPEVTLGDIRAGARRLPTLIYAEGRYYIES